MDKKELKFYEAPACDVVELMAQSALLAGSDFESNTPGVSEEGAGEGI